MIAVCKTSKESFKDVCTHLPQWIRVAFAPFVVWVVGFLLREVKNIYLLMQTKDYSFLIQSLTGEKVVEVDVPFFLSFGLLAFLGIIISWIAILVFYVNGYRYAALKKRGDKWWTFCLNKRLVKMFLYYLAIGFIIGSYALIASIIVAVPHFLSGGNMFLTVPIGAVFLLGLLYLMARWSLTLLYVALDREKALRTSWRNMEGNEWRLIGLLFLILLSIFGVFAVGAVILGGVGWLLSLISLWLVIPIVVLAVLLVIFMFLLLYAVPMKALALVNQQLTLETIKK